jgi:hypothetical protein
MYKHWVTHTFFKSNPHLTPVLLSTLINVTQLTRGDLVFPTVSGYFLPYCLLVAAYLLPILIFSVTIYSLEGKICIFLYRANPFLPWHSKGGKNRSCFWANFNLFIYLNPWIKVQLISVVFEQNCEHWVCKTNLIGAGLQIEILVKSIYQEVIMYITLIP